VLLLEYSNKTVVL